MDENVKVTIGIPVYNAARFLSLAIKSVLDQTYENFELIISDDGSTDNSLLIAQSFNDSRIAIIADGRNKGISYRLNEQISLAKGKYFARMDADDLMFPERIEKQVNFLENNETFDVVGSTAIVIDDDNYIIGFRDSKVPVSIERASKTSVFIHPTILGKTSWFRRFAYSNELMGVEDYDLWIRSFNYSKFHIFEEPLFFYRDPLRMKMSTYLFRHRQFRISVWKNRKITLSYKNTTYLLLTSYFKVIVYKMATLFRIEHILMSRRNTSICNNKLMYDKILRGIIN